MKKFKVSRIFLLLIVIILSGIFIYLNTGIKSHVDVDAYKNRSDITVEEDDGGILVKRPGDETLVVFYPGARIETSSYLPLFYDLAERGIDSYLVKMPFNFAFLNPDAYEKIPERYDYKSYYLSGHSLGGAIGANFLAESDVDCDGLILLAAYPSKDLSHKNLPLLSIYGDRDSVLNRENYEKSKNYWPKENKEVILPGANHSGFGDYGEQKGDQTRSISREKQLAETSAAIADFIYENEQKKLSGPGN